MATETQIPPSAAKTSSLKAQSALSSNDSTAHSMRCPDPSAHQTKSTSLQDQASAAALYSTRPHSKTKTAGRDVNILGPDGKLSSASAATSLKYAQAHDLPGFPVVGIDTQSSAGTAALLANANKKSPEWWKPEQSAAAGKAALLANDYKMAPIWQPEASAAGSKAALLAHRGGSNVNLWTPQASADGHSAANIAMRAPRPVTNTSAATNERHNKALLAATGAVTSSGQKRAQSTPVAHPMYPDSHNSAKNALSAAKLAHTPSMKVTKSQTSPVVTDSNRLGSGAMEAARIQHSKSIAREMYTERPPIALEVEEKQHQDALRASAISMAKKMYDVQQTQIDQAAGRSSISHAQTGANAAHGQQSGSADADIKEQAMRYIGIQEAAQKLAAERLAKIGPDENAAFRSYYGYEKPSRTKLSIRRGRNRAASNPETVDSDDDDFRSRRIRTQMSQLNKTLAEVDAQKQEQDRKHLLAAAERKVQAQMLGMDKKIFDQTGKMSPAMVEEWDAKARAKAAAASETRMENHGRIHIGNGKYMDQAEIDAVALARIQPTLDEITEKTEKRRAEDEERRLDLEQKKWEQQRERARQTDLKAEEKRIKDEEKKAAKTRTAQEKSTLRMEREAEKERQAEEKRQRDGEKRISREAPKGTAASLADGNEPTTTKDETASAPTATGTTNTTENDDLYRDATPAGPEAHASDPELETTSPTSPKSDSKGLKSFLNKFKRRSKQAPPATDTEKQPAFIGGASLQRSHTHNSAPTSPDQVANKSERRYSDVSSMSSSGRGRTPERTTTGISAASGDTDFEEAKDGFDEELSPPPNFTTTDAHAGRKGSPTRDSKFHEIGI